MYIMTDQRWVPGLSEYRGSVYMLTPPPNTSIFNILKKQKDMMC